MKIRFAGFITLFIISCSVCLAQEKKVLIIGIDGLMPEAVGLPEVPNINSLYEDDAGFLTFGYTEDLTFSGPSWSSILHGVHRDRHGVDTNQYHGHDYSEYPNVLKRLKNHDSDLYTAAFVTWSLLQNNFSLPDGSPAGVDQLVYHARQEGGDQKVTDDLAELLETGDPDAVFYYQNDIDGAGHGYGFSIDSPEYREQLRITDSRIGQVLDALYSRRGVAGGDEEWLIVLVTDHGGVGTGHGGNLYRQRFIPVILSGPAAGPQAPYMRLRNMYVTRTVLSFMGVPDVQMEDLDGYDILSLDRERIPSAGYGKNLVFNGAGEFDRGFEDRQLDQVITGWRDQEHTGDRDGYHSMTLIKAPDELQYTGSDGGKGESGPEGEDGSRRPGMSDGNAGLSESGLNRESNLFAGGRKGLNSKITQRIDLGELAHDIESRCVSFQFSGHLGGAGSSEDRMEGTVYFLDESGDILDTAVLKSVTAADRNGETALVYRETGGLVSPGTKSVLIELQAIGTSGDGIDALADQMSFILSCDPPAME